MKKIIFNPETDKFENMEAEMVDVKTRKPNAVPPKTQTFKKPVIIAGGVSSLNDIKKISELGAYAVVLGMALYTGKINLQEAIQCLQKE